jgi:hypothetical protein
LSAGGKQADKGLDGSMSLREGGENDYATETQKLPDGPAAHPPCR